MRTSKPRTESKIRRWIERILLLIGLGGIAVWAASIALPWLWQDWASWTFDREVAGSTPSISAYLSERSEQIEERVEVWLGIATPKTQTENTPHIATPREDRPVIGPDGLFGRVTIPRLSLSAIVREGTSSKTLSLAAGHIPGTSVSGSKGNIAIAGHRDTLFRGLRGIEEGDLIELETLEGRFQYKVKSTDIVDPTDVDVLNPGPNPELTLVTCYPFDYIGSAPKRFIVKAAEVSKAKTDSVTWREVSLQNERRQIVTRPIEQRKPGPKKVAFSIAMHHSRELVPGISVGFTDADVLEGRVYGWMWLMPDRRTMWLRDQPAHDPLIFYSGPNGSRRELTITNITANSVSGYLLLPE
jgi:LPXTG-site transpeptidase (sortase) family protein